MFTRLFVCSSVVAVVLSYIYIYLFLRKVFADRFSLSFKDGKVKAHWKEMGAKTDEEKMASVKSTAHVEQVLAAM